MDSDPRTSRAEKALASTSRSGGTRWTAPAPRRRREPRRGSRGWRPRRVRWSSGRGGPRVHGSPAPYRCRATPRERSGRGSFGYGVEPCLVLDAEAVREIGVYQNAVRGAFHEEARLAKPVEGQAFAGGIRRGTCDRKRSGRHGRRRAAQSPASFKAKRSFPRPLPWPDRCSRR